jgi:acyl-CoA thioester hydrolase
MDWNSHMSNTAYLDKVVDARVIMLTELGFPLEEFARLRRGVIAMKDELEYRREVKWMEEITITVLVDGLAADGSRFKIKNEILASDGALCARVTTTGGFLNLDERKIVAPPQSILAAYQSLPRTEGFAELPSSITKRV